MGFGSKAPMGIGDKDPITFGQFLVLITLGVLFTQICVWIGPATAVILSIGAISTLLVVIRRFRPSWIKAFWTWCIDVGQNSRFPR